MGALNTSASAANYASGARLGAYLKTVADVRRSCGVAAGQQQVCAVLAVFGSMKAHPTVVTLTSTVETTYPPITLTGRLRSRVVARQSGVMPARLAKRLEKSRV